MKGIAYNLKRNVPGIVYCANITCTLPKSAGVDLEAKMEVELWEKQY